MLSLALLLALPADPPTPAALLIPRVVPLSASGAEVAPAPREKVCSHRGSPDCLCPDGDLRCRARAALAIAAAAKTVPVAMPSREALAARKALQDAEQKIKASKIP